MTLAGCGTTLEQPPDPAYQSHIGRVAVVVTEKAPELKFEGFARGKGAGAAMGAGSTFSSCLSGGGYSAGAGGAVVFIIALGICGIAGMVGGLAGAAGAPSADQAAASEALLSQAVEVRTIQESLQSAVVDAARAAGVEITSVPAQAARQAAAQGDYRPLASLGVDTVLEATLTKAGTAGAGVNHPSTAYMEVHVRLVDTAGNAQRLASDYRYEGRRLDLAGWSAEQGKPLHDELLRGYRTLGSHVSDNVFQLYPFPDRSPGPAFMATAFGLAGIYPPTGEAFLTQNPLSIEELSPRFMWEAFPRAADMAAAPEEMARVSGVTYELVVAREENMAPGEVIYHRDGIASNEHDIAVPLQPATRYFWTVRARFVLDGRRRVSEWSSTHFAARDKFTAPSQYSYLFRTKGKR